ncbi:MAG: hypothetical protein ACO3GK_01275 [Bacteroidia bacterium]
MTCSTCQKAETSPIPAYLIIDSTRIVCQQDQGNGSHDIAGVQVFANQEFIGNFLFPARIPILKSGLVALSINPMIRINGASSQFTVFRTLNTLDTSVLLEATKETHLSAAFRFKSNAQIDWQEDFEDQSSTLVPLSRQKGDTAYMAQETLRGASTWVYRVDFEDSDTTKKIDLGSFRNFMGWPKDGTEIFLEFDIRCDVPVQLALRRKSAGNSSYVPYLLLNKTGNQWKRFYCNLVYEVSGQAPDTEFQILFSADKLNSETGSLGFALDNIRLSYLN